MPYIVGTWAVGVGFRVLGLGHSAAGQQPMDQVSVQEYFEWAVTSKPSASTARCMMKQKKLSVYDETKKLELTGP